MTELFSRVSENFTKALLIGAFFPVLLFLTAVVLVLLPMTPYGGEFTAAVKTAKAWEDSPLVVLEITIVVLVLSVVLSSMNIPIVRLYEGYPWKDSWIGRICLAVRRKHFRDLSVVRGRLKRFRLHLRRLNIQELGEPAWAGTAQGQLARAMNTYYPNDESLVLPTRLGNVIRAFETYTSRQYGVAIVNLWPRLMMTVEDKVVAAVENAKTAFDFMLHASFLSAVLALLILGCGLYWHPLSAPTWLPPWLAWTVLFGGISYAAYRAAISQALVWGGQVKVAFDLYRFDLLKQLGYELQPADLSEERRIWEVVNYQFAFPDERTYPDLSYKQSSSGLTVTPISTKIETKRSVHLSQDEIELRLIIVNKDPTAADARRVVVHERIPEGCRYIPASALGVCPSNRLGTLTTAGPEINQHGEDLP